MKPGRGIASAPRGGRKRATVLLAFGGYLNTAIVMIQGLVLVPCYLRFIGAHLYGLWLSSGGVLAMLGILQFGLGNLLIQRVASAHGRHDRPAAAAYFVNGVCVYALLALALVAVGTLCSFGLSRFLGASGNEAGELAPCFRLAVMAAGLGMINECLRGFAQALLRPTFSTLALAAARIAGTAVIVLLLYRQAGLWAIPAGMLLTELLALVAGAAQALVLYRGLQAPARLDRALVREYFQVGSGLLLAKVGNVVSRECDPVLITLLLRPELTTAYMTTRRAADIVFGLLNVLGTSAFGSFSHLAGEGGAARTREVARKVFALTSVLGLIGFVSYVALDYAFVSLWVGKQLALDQSVILCIGLGFFAYSLRNFQTQALNGLGHFNFTSLVVFGEGLGKVALAFLLLKHFGVVGAPLALILVSCFSLATIGVELIRRLQVEMRPLDLLRVGTPLVILFALAETVGLYLTAPGSWGIFASQAVAVVLAATLAASLFHRPLFREMVQECLCRE